MSLLVRPGDSAIVLRNFCVTSNILPIIRMQHHEIPVAVLQHIFPSQTLSIFDFISFKSPSPIPVPQLEAGDIYLSDAEPNVSDDEIHPLLFMTPPPPSIIQDLISCLHSVSPSTGRSVAHNVSSAKIKRYPLWVLTYWTEKNHVRGQKQQWTQAQKTLQKLHQQGGNIRALVDDVYVTLKHLPWSGSIEVFGEGHDIGYLHTYATAQWLKSNHENEMLDLLEEDISERPGTMIRPTDFIPSLLSVFRRRHGLKTSFVPLKPIAEAFISGGYQHLATIMNCKDIHWVALVIDFRQKTLWHGDSLGWPMEKEVMEALRWWLTKLTSEPLVYRKLEITHQRDSFSCGLLAWNALAHFFQPANHPLIDPLNVAAARLRVLVRLCQKHYHNVSCQLLKWV